MTNKNETGFTIVELLIVIVVIAVLAAISIVAYTGIQGRARDAQRIQDMHTIVKALEIYKTINGDFPSHNPTPDADGWEVSSDGGIPTNFLSALTSGSTGIDKVPIDPVNSTGADNRAGRSNPNRIYYYARYGAGSWGCDSSRGAFYILGVARMDGVTLGTNHSQSPGFSCTNRDWQSTGAWLTGRFVK